MTVTLARVPFTFLSPAAGIGCTPVGRIISETVQARTLHISTFHTANGFLIYISWLPAISSSALKFLYLLLRRAKLLVNQELLLEARTSSSPSHAAINSPAYYLSYRWLYFKNNISLITNPNCSLPWRWKLSGFVSLPLVVIQ